MWGYKHEPSVYDTLFNERETGRSEPNTHYGTKQGHFKKIT
jgi:hypothetical protein